MLRWAAGVYLKKAAGKERAARSGAKDLIAGFLSRDCRHFRLVALPVPGTWPVPPACSPRGGAAPNLPTKIILTKIA